MEIQAGQALLRDLEMTDARDLAGHSDDIDISKYLVNMPHPYSVADAEYFIRCCRKEMKQRPRVNYELAITLDNSVIGMVGITHHDQTQGTATIGYWLGREHWRRGLTFNAVQAMLHFGFDRLRVRRFESEVFAENGASQRLLEKAGFKKEGLARKKCISMATRCVHDAVLYGLLAEDYGKR